MRESFRLRKNMPSRGLTYTSLNENGVIFLFSKVAEDLEYVEIPMEEYERLEAAVKEMSTPYHSALDFVHKQVDEVLEKYDAWLQEKEEHEKRQRKRG